MTKRILFTVIIVLIGLTAFSQKGHRIAFVDMNYILENIPDYKKAQSQLNTKVKKWQQNLDNLKDEIGTMKTDLSNEKALLTADLIIEKEEDIAIKEEEFKKLEEQYFSSNGNLFMLRKQLVTPIQDQVYNASQEIAKARRYDFVFDKSSDLIMLYSTKQNDISELVLRSIVRGEKTTKANEKRASRTTTQQRKTTSTVKNTPSVQTTNANPTPKTTNNPIALPVVVNEEVKSDAKAVETETSLTEKTVESAVLTEKPTKNITKEATEISEVVSPEASKQGKLDEREIKRQEALARNEKIKADRLKKREEQKAEIEKKRLERLKKREEVRNQLKENKEVTEKEKEDKKEDENKDNN